MVKALTKIASQLLVLSNGQIGLNTATKEPIIDGIRLCVCLIVVQWVMN